jgi:hypothetical protein
MARSAAITQDERMVFLFHGLILSIITPEALCRSGNPVQASGMTRSGSLCRRMQPIWDTFTCSVPRPPHESAGIPCDAVGKPLRPIRTRRANRG